jgi:hypothetical protein
MEGSDDFLEKKAIIAVERRILMFKPATGLWKSSSECAFYLSNRPVLAGQAADAIRKHWGIENKQHYTRHLPRRRFAHLLRPGNLRQTASFAYNIAQDRYAAALGGIEALNQMKYFK